MKHLIIFAHPNSKSLNGLLKQSVVNFLAENNHEVILRDLYQQSFNPILSLDDMAGQRMGQVTEEIKKEQEYIEWVEVITFIYPIWWTGLPVMMKGYIERVFSYGFAYRYDEGIQKGLLKNKQAVIINTHGKSHAEYNAIGMDKALELTSDKGIFTYCGLAIKKHVFLEKADKANAEVIAKWKQNILSVY
ncbi:NAD(P)H-dependent oxidoreductase [Chondrinema litorale]|uniref:NAD(P)H-dependent oxidoreductase n=1 Tax=Chondrinema litorale TaxID=2994555 RepID=UPI00254272E1|nr:NAD(P)H-dependent oxidoreductase [Chondrinema litorale]UZR96404.1 NAD(P)H-dependent oxidoreductase [Chondrinema litorale]